MIEATRSGDGKWLRGLFLFRMWSLMHLLTFGLLRKRPAMIPGWIEPQKELPTRADID